MKKYFLVGLVFGLVLILTNPLEAQDKGFGIGFVLGEPTGLSAKYWTTNVNAFDFGLGFTLGGDRFAYKGTYDGKNRMHFHMDYLWHSLNAINASQRFPLYYGLGGRFNTGGGYEGSFGVRGVFGIAWWPYSTSLDLFVEIVPVFQITPVTGFGIDAGLGIRYFLN
ncbi:MAG: hypothetical protein Q8N03_13175 [Ignavibacteria bacterium]|nr:hypothetical protein [Ignavibacteria bacterium]MDP3831716.1 hypothetical protein [Ignavibacteriaceae bacterium]